MMQPPPASTSRPDEPGPRLRSFIAMLLRVGLGLHLLNAGLMGYLYQNTPAGGFRGANPYLRLGVYPVTEVYYHYLPYIQVAVGLGLVLGFMTAVAAGAAGLLVLFHPLAQTVILLGTGLPTDPYSSQSFGIQTLLSAGGTSNLLLTAVVLWFSTSGVNAWSLDGLVFSHRAAPAPRPGFASSGWPARVTAGNLPDLPGGPAGLPRHEFDMDTMVMPGDGGAAP